MGDIVPLAQLRTLVDLVPRFWETSEQAISKEIVLEFNSELNKYFEKDPFYAFNAWLLHLPLMQP